MIKKLSIQPASGLQGDLSVLGDKSVSHRGLILGAISQGTTTLHHFLPAADCLSTLTALQKLGCQSSVSIRPLRSVAAAYVG